jgi:divinyl protochlorophyllide a 8-vinyl-reductase
MHGPITLSEPGPPQRSDVAGSVGPNAVTRVPAALRAAGLADRIEFVFTAAGVPDWLGHPPQHMVDERRVARLHRTLRAELSPALAHAVLTDAGRLTADYLLSARIPRLAQVLLKLLPATLSTRLLVPAIRAHAWTFAGSGRFTAEAGNPTIFAIRANPLCAGERASMPICAWHVAVFERLFKVLVSPTTRVVETSCVARGDDCCRFVAHFGRPALPSHLSNG